MSGQHSSGQAWWESHLHAIIEEGISTKSYADREGLSVTSLYYWRKRLKAEKQIYKPTTGPAALSPTAVAPKLRFAPVAIKAQRVEAGGCMLTFDSGLRLELPGLPSPQWLAQVHQAVGAQGV